MNIIVKRNIKLPQGMVCVKHCYLCALAEFYSHLVSVGTSLTHTNYTCPTDSLLTPDFTAEDNVNYVSNQFIYV